MVMSFLYYRYRNVQESRVIHGEKLMNVGNEGMSKMVSLYSIILCSYVFSS